MSWLLGIFLLVLPFERIPSFDVVVFTVRISSIVLVFFALFVLPKLVLLRQTRPIKLLDKLILVFLALTAVSIIGSHDIHRSLIVLALLAFVQLGYLLVSRLITDEKTLLLGRQMLIVAALVTAVFGLFQFFGDSLGF